MKVTALDTEIAAGDFDDVGATPYSDTVMSYANWTLSIYNDFTLNSIAISALQAAVDGDGKFKIGVRNANYDVAGVAPAWSAPTTPKTVLGTFYSGNAFGKPRLVVTHIPVVTPAPGGFAGLPLQIILARLPIIGRQFRFPRDKYKFNEWGTSHN